MADQFQERPDRSLNELARRIERAGINPDGIVDPRLRTFIDRVGSQPANITQADYLRTQYGILDTYQGKAEQGEPGFRTYNNQELATVLGPLNQWIEELDNNNRRQPGAPQPGVAFVDQLAEAIHGKHLSQDEKYIKMQDDEQWNNNPIQPINPDNAPGYYIDMTEEERQLHEIRVELNNACFLKRNKGFTLDALSKEVPYAGLSKTETKLLYDGIPGLKQAVKLYIHLIDTGQDVAGHTLLDAKGRDDLLVIRGTVRNTIEQFIPPTVDDDTIELKARDAEQIAFNLLILGNTFESLDSQWSNGQRNRAPQMTSELLIIPIKNSMKPLDSLIASLGKKPEKFASVGAFGNWAYSQIRAANHGHELDLKQINRVRIVLEKKGNENKFWTVGDRGRTLNVPECYPTKIIGSVWEETKVKIGGNDVPLLDLIRQSRDGSIPWDSIEGEDMWGTYAYRLGKAGAVWDLLQGKSLIKFGDDDQIKLWVDAVTGALSQFELGNNPSLKRWIMYASMGVDTKKREPKLRDKSKKLSILGQLGPKMANYLRHDQLMFPWDSGRGFL